MRIWFDFSWIWQIVPQSGRHEEFKFDFLFGDVFRNGKAHLKDTLRKLIIKEILTIQEKKSGLVEAEFVMGTDGAISSATIVMSLNEM